MELATRRIVCFGVTENPNQEWVSQQARNLTRELQAQGSQAKFLICDNDKKFPLAFEHVLREYSRAPDIAADTIEVGHGIRGRVQSHARADQTDIDHGPG